MKKIGFIVVILLCVNVLHGQTYIINNGFVNGETIYTCSGTFFDSGGSAGQYGNNEDYTVTFCSDSNNLRVVFQNNQISLHSAYTDTLYIYDGPDVNSPLAYAHVGNMSANPFTSSGPCVTFRFVSNASGTAPGWRASFSCPTPPTPCNGNLVAADNCMDAPFICNLNGYCGNTSDYYTRDLPGNFSMGGTLNPTLWVNTIENNSWLRFIADSTAAVFHVTTTNCTNNQGIQMGIYRGTNCNNFTLVSDPSYTNQAQMNFTIVAQPLTPGQMYYLMVDGFAGDVCDYSIEALGGVAVGQVNAGNDTTICGGSATLIGTGAEPGTGSWASVDSSFYQNGDIITVQPSVTTSYVYSGQSGNIYCPENVTDTVTVFVGQINFNAGPDTTICGSNTVNLIASGGSDYLWSTGATVASISVSPSVTTIYTVTVSESGCSETAQVEVTVIPFDATITPTDTSVCLNDPVTISVTGGSTYAWSTGANTPSINITATHSATYSVTVSDDVCSAVLTSVVSIQPPPIAVAPNDTTICSGNQISLTGSGGGSYAWSTGQTGQTIQVAPTSQTSYTLTVSIGSCFSTDAVTIFVDDPIVADAGDNQTVCESQEAHLTATGGTHYFWSTGQNGQNITVTPTQTTSYTVTASDGACSASDAVTVCVGNAPNIVIQVGDNMICPLDSTWLQVIGATDVRWSPAIGLSATNGLYIKASPSSATTYTAIGYDANGCPSQPAYVTIGVHPPLNSSATASSNGTICQGESFQIYASTSGGNGGPYGYTWSHGPGTAQPPVSLSPTESITITYTVADNCVEPYIGTVDLIVYPVPEVEMLVQPSEGCVPHTATFSIQPDSEISSWNWNFGNSQTFPTNNTSSASSPSHTYHQPGVYNVSCTMVTTNGCTISISQNAAVTVYNSPEAFFTFSPNHPTTLENKVHFTDLSVGGPVSWLWNFGDAQNQSGQSIVQHPDYSFYGPGTYWVSLWVTNAYGCTDSTTMKVTVKSEYTFWMPSAFTPDQDGLNDYFGPKGLGLNTENYEMYIYNRWGEVIWYTNDIENHWDGNSGKDAKPAPEGIYVWLITFQDLNNKPYKKIGNVTLFRTGGNSSSW